MVVCAIVGCGNRSGRDRGKSFYRLPAVISNQETQTKALSRKRRDAWLAKIRREDISPEQYYNIRVSSDHFINGSPSRLYDETNPDWAPSLKLVFEASASGRSERYDRALKMCLSEESMEMVDTVTLCREENDTEMENEEECCNTVTTRTEIVVQTEEMEDHRQLTEEMEKLKKENDRLKLTNHHLTLKIEEQGLTEDNFRNNDTKVLYYTGLCKWELFVALFEYVKPYLQTTGKSSLSSFQQLLLTLMRLRNNLSFPDLGYRFEIHPTTVSRIFNRVLDLLFIKLKPLIKWPGRAA